MGYDVSFHPISPEEMQKWYFTPLTWVQQGQEEKVLEDLEGLWSNGQLAVLKKALTAAAELGAGLLEATEVVEPNPIHPNGSTSYSNLYHCDRDGVYLYIDTVSGQLADAIRNSEAQT